MILARGPSGGAPARDTTAFPPPDWNPTADLPAGRHLTWQRGRARLPAAAVLDDLRGLARRRRTAARTLHSCPSVLARIQSAGLMGIEAHPVTVEVDVANGLPGYHLVGQASPTVREGRVRIRAALQNSGFKVPPRKIIVSLAPADVRKEGSAYDLPVGLGVLVAEGLLPEETTRGWLFMGELGLDGSLRPVRGVLPATVLARRMGLRGVVVPPGGNAAEARVVRGLRVVAPPTFAALMAHLLEEERLPDLGGAGDGGADEAGAGGEQTTGPGEVSAGGLAGGRGEEAVDLADVRGQAQARRALEVAAAGGHNLLLFGPPGTGKTMLARRLPTLLPPLSFDDALEATSVWSVAGLLEHDAGLLAAPPFRAPHHTVSDAGLCGGGSPPRPGEVSLAHRGVLFLDEVAEFRRGALEALRQPLEDRRITISRARQAVTFPAQVTLVAAMNPCPCGHLGDPRRACRCSLEAVRSYRNRLSGPLLDRIDLQVEVPVPTGPLLRAHDFDPSGPPTGRDTGLETSAVVRARVIAARQRQHERHGPHGPSCNAELGPRGIRRHCAAMPAAMALLETAMERLGLSARAHDRILKVARTIADLEGSARVTAVHVAEAIHYRGFDRDPRAWDGLGMAPPFAEACAGGG